MSAAMEIPFVADSDGHLLAREMNAAGQNGAAVISDRNNVAAAIFAFQAEIRCSDANRPLADLAARRHLQPGLVDNPGAFRHRSDLCPGCIDLTALLDEARQLIGHRVGVPVDLDVGDEEPLWPVLADAHRVKAALIDLAAGARDTLPRAGMLCITAHNAAAAPAEDRAAAVCIVLSVRDAGRVAPPAVVMQVLYPACRGKDGGAGPRLGPPGDVAAAGCPNINLAAVAGDDTPAPSKVPCDKAAGTGPDGTLLQRGR